MSEYVELGDGVRCRIVKVVEEAAAYSARPIGIGPRKGVKTTFELKCRKDDSASVDIVARFFSKADKKTCEVWDLYLYPQPMRGKGIGTQALFLLGSEMWKRGCRDFSGWPVEESIRFWRRAGAVDEISRFKWDPGGRD